METTLQKFFGFDAFRDGQRKMVEATLAGKDSVSIMATGSGKSVCYQLPALLQDKAVVVISPLISLMADQAVKLNETVGTVFLREKGSKEVAAIVGGNTGKSNCEIESMVRRASCRFLYMTPEKLQTSGLHLLTSLADRIALIAIDEAHCVSEWGHDFRPDYRNVGVIRGALPDTPIMALTATATPQVRTDIITSLGLREPVIHVGDFFRPNLRLFALPRRGMSDLNQLVDQLKTTPKPTIIYCSSRNEVDTVKQYLEARVTNQAVLQYHAGMSDGLRLKSHMAFLTGRTDEGLFAWAMVATIAFGMGIDKPDIRQIVHLGPPRTIEAYYQQAGRAGRDGQPSTCVVYYAANDFVNYTTSEFYAPKNPDGSININQKQALDKSTVAMRSLCESEGCRQQALVSYLEQQQVDRRCGVCDNCSRSQTEKEDFGEYARIIIKGVQRGNGKAKGGHIDFLMGTAETQLRNKGHLQGDDPLFGSWKSTGNNREVLKIFIEMLCRDGLLSAQTSTFATTSGYTAGYEVLAVTPTGQTFATSGTPWLCNTPPLLVEERAKKLERTRKVRAEMEGKIHSVPEEELAEGDGPMLRVERDWSALLKRKQDADEKDNGTRVQTALALLDGITQWTSIEANRLHMAPHSVLPVTTAKKVAYVACSSRVSLEALEAIGLRAGDLSKLVQVIDNARPKRDLEEDNEADEVICLPEGWRPSSAVAGAPKMSATVIESVDLFCAGLDPTAVGMKRAKQIAASTVENHLMTALLNCYPKLFPHLQRLWDMLPTKNEILRIEQAMETAGVSKNDLNKAKGDIVRAIDGDSSWYPKLSWFNALHQLNVPYTFKPAQKERAAKVQKTE